MSGRLPAPFTIKMWCGGLGFIAGLIGVALDLRWLVWVAVGLLGVAFLARFLRSPAGADG